MMRGQLGVLAVAGWWAAAASLLLLSSRPAAAAPDLDIPTDSLGCDALCDVTPTCQSTLFDWSASHCYLFDCIVDEFQVPSDFTSYIKAGASNQCPADHGFPSPGVPPETAPTPPPLLTWPPQTPDSAPTTPPPPPEEPSPCDNCGSDDEPPSSTVDGVRRPQTTKTGSETPAPSSGQDDSGGNSDTGGGGGSSTSPGDTKDAGVPAAPDANGGSKDNVLQSSVAILLLLWCVSLTLLEL